MITLSGITKRFGRLEVLRGVSVTAGAGRVTGIVGPNAAGKTTLMKIILGLTRPDQGEVFVGNTRVNGDERYRSDIGYMPQIARFPSNLTGRELIGMLRDIRSSQALTDDDLVASLGVESELGKKLNVLSGGTRQKINAVAAFMFDPAILILDEPTAGLDPRSSAVFKDRILADRGRGKTVIITSHVMSELEELADDVILIWDGKVQFSGSTDEIIGLTRQANLERAVAQLMSRGFAA